MSSKRSVMIAGFLLLLPIAVVAQRTVTGVSIVARPAVYNGPCPATIQFISTIRVSRFPVMVDYRWERSDGAIGPRRKVRINSAGRGVTDTWTLGSSRGQHFRIWERLHVLAPTGIQSQGQVVTVNCR